MKRFRRALVLSLPGLVAVGLGAWLALPRTPVVVPVVREDGEDYEGEVEDEPLLDPLSAAHGLAGLAAPDPRPAAPALPGAPAPGNVAPENATPEDIAREVGARVSLVPYYGALASPVQVLEAGVANALDRARTLAALLRQAGHEARVVHGPGALPPCATPADRGTLDPTLRAGLEARVRALAPRAWAVIAGEREWLERAEATPPAGRLAWVQVRRDGAWVDLPLPREAVDPAARRATAPLDDAALGRLAWTVTLRLTNVPQGAGKPRDVLVHTARAEALHAAGVAVTNLPDRASARFVPTLRVAGRTIQGTPFDGRTLARQHLSVEVRGPGGVRRATRVLVGRGRRPRAALPPARRRGPAPRPRAAGRAGPWRRHGRRGRRHRDLGARRPARPRGGARRRGERAGPCARRAVLAAPPRPRRLLRPAREELRPRVVAPRRPRRADLRRGGRLDAEAKALEAALRALFPDLVAGVAEAFLQQVIGTAALAPGLRAAGTGLRDLWSPPSLARARRAPA